MPLPLAAAGLHTLDYVIVLVYMLGMVALGLYLYRRQGTAEDFFVGGRRMPWLATGLSMLATLMSTLTYLGLPGETIGHGVGLAISLAALPLAYVVVAYVWVPFFMRLRLTSAYEYLERRFGTGARMYGVVLYLYMRFLWMGMIVFTASLAVAQITQDTAPGAIAAMTGGLVRMGPTEWFYFVLIATGVISTLYTMLGGIQAVVWTDVVQFTVLFAGAALTLVLVAANTGTGPAAWWAEVTTGTHEIPPLASWDLTERTTIVWMLLAGFMWHVCTHASDQVALQRYFTTASAKAARRTAAVNFTATILIQVLLALVGMALLVYYLHNPGELPPGVTDPRDPAFADEMFPRFITYGLPIGISGLVLAAVFAVAQSSIDSGINSTATVITVDLVRRFRSQPLTDRGELRLAQWLTLGIGLFVTLTGVAVTLLPEKYNILELQFRSFNSVLGPLGAVFMAGIFFRHVGQEAVLVAGVAGAAAGLLFAYAEVLWGVKGPSPFLIIPLSWLITFGLAYLLGWVLPRPRREQVEGLTMRTVGGR